MNFKTNFSKTLLLSNRPITIFFENEKVSIKIPTILETIEDDYVNKFINILSKEKGDFPDLITNFGFKATTLYGVFLGFAQSSYDSVLGIKDTFLNFVDGVTFKDRSFYIGDNKMNEEQFELIRIIVLIGCGIKNFKAFEELKKDNSVEELDDYSKKLRDRIKRDQERIKAIKKNAKNEKDDSSKMEDIIIGICHYFPSYDINKILNLNFYTYMSLAQKVQELDINFVQQIAAGNGLLKDRYKPLF